MRSRLGEASDAAGFQDAREVREDLLRIGRVMERVEADDAIDAGVGQIDAPAVVRQKARRGTLADDWHPPVELARDLQRGRRDVQEDGLAAELREEARQPTGAAAEVENDLSGR